MLPAAVIHILKDQSTLISPRPISKLVLPGGGATAEREVCAGAPRALNPLYFVSYWLHDHSARFRILQ